MLQETVARVTGEGFTPPIMLCNEEHRFLVAEQLREISVTPGEIVLEPVARSTAPAAAVAALLAQQKDPKAMVLVLPSDHVITDTPAFNDALSSARQAAAKGYLVTFGMAATGPETGYGYIRRGQPLDSLSDVHRIDRFVEKPSAEKARAMLAEGGYDWNSGMFLFSVTAYLKELETHKPEILQTCRRALETGAQELDFRRLGNKAFNGCPSESIDIAVMEKTDMAVVVPAEIGWNDIGSWSALWNIGDRDGDENLFVGDVVAENVSGSYLRSENRLLAAIGLENMVVVATDDAILVSTRDQDVDIKILTEHLKQDQRPEYHTHLKVLRPWGWYQSIDTGAKFQVKRLCVNPGKRLSLQYHYKRTEHWIVVSGVARVTRDDEVFDLAANQSTSIGIKQKHRLENKGTEPLHIIEVQYGDYLGEDDIVRLGDDFERN